MSNLKYNFFNKYLSVLLSAVITGPALFQPVHCIDTELDDVILKIEEDNPSIMSKIKEWCKEHWIVSGVIRSSILTLALAGINVGTLSLLSRYSEKIYEDLLKQKFCTTPNKFTKKQEGIRWCWIACLQGIYKYNGFEISQENIYKAIFNKAPSYFSVKRAQGLPVGILPKGCTAAINSININFKFNKAMIYYRDFEDLKSIENCIRDYYNSIGKKAFAIVDSFISGKSSLHFVNVVDITGEMITIEDPQSGLSRTEKLQDFCQRYYPKIMRVTPIIEMVSLVKHNFKIAPEINYFCREDSCKGIGNFLKICY